MYLYSFATILYNTCGLMVHKVIFVIKQQIRRKEFE